MALGVVGENGEKVPFWHHCVTCDGAGDIEYLCTTCDGDGCYQCNGVGYVDKVCDICNGSGIGPMHVHKYEER